MIDRSLPGGVIRVVALVIRVIRLLRAASELASLPEAAGVSIFFVCLFLLVLF